MKQDARTFRDVLIIGGNTRDPAKGTNVHEIFGHREEIPRQPQGLPRLGSGRVKR
jgi:hypothetical protein